MVDGNQRHASASAAVVLADEYVSGVAIGVGEPYVQHADLVDLLHRERAGSHVLAAAAVTNEGLHGPQLGHRRPRSGSGSALPEGSVRAPDERGRRHTGEPIIRGPAPGWVVEDVGRDLPQRPLPDARPFLQAFAGGRHGEAAPARVVGGHRGMGSSSAALNTTTMSSAGATVVCARDGGDLGLLPLILSHPHSAVSSSAVISGLAALASPTYNTAEEESKHRCHEAWFN